MSLSDHKLIACARHVSDRYGGTARVYPSLMHLTAAELRMRIEALAVRASAVSDESSWMLMETAPVMRESEQVLGSRRRWPRCAAWVTADRSAGSDGGNG